MDFHKMPRSTILHLYLGRLFASDGRTDGRTDGRRANFLERYDFDNHPFGVDKYYQVTYVIRMCLSSVCSNKNYFAVICMFI